jgi:spermidine synthase
MILELVGSRIMAPYLGTSIIVWTSLIGVILGCLSLGYWWGGRVADRKPSYQVFSSLIMTAGVLIAAIAFIKEPVLERLQTGIMSIELAAPVATIILFGLPSTLLGMVTPYAVRLKMADVEHSGRTVGNLYAISTIGSIVGTFLAGYYLIAFFGSTKILLVMAIVLMLTASIAWWRGRIMLQACLMFLLVVALGAVGSYSTFRADRGFHDVDTRYSRILVYDTVHPVNERHMRVMVTNPSETQSARYLDGSDELVSRYTQFYRLAEHFTPHARTALMIGGAGYSYPRDFLMRFPAGRIDVVEIDPGMTALARQHFGLKDDPRLGIIHEDGRTFLNRSKARYDAIFSDAFTSLYTIPFQLTTRESVQRLHALLNDGGAVFVNIISAIEGEKGRFLRAEYATFSSVFPQVYLFPVHDPGDGALVQNIMLVAIKSDRMPLFTSQVPELRQYLSHRLLQAIPRDVAVLTDEYAPVDNYIMPVLRDRS